MVRDLDPVLCADACVDLAVGPASFENGLDTRRMISLSDVTKCDVVHRLAMGEGEIVIRAVVPFWVGSESLPACCNSRLSVSEVDGDFEGSMVSAVDIVADVSIIS